MNTFIEAVLKLGISAILVPTFSFATGLKSYSTETVVSQFNYKDQSFSCDEQQLSTLVQSHWGKLPLIRWTDRSFPPPYTPVKRCQEITARFNKFENNGTLKYMTTGKINNYPVICVAAYKGGSCLPNGLLITLKQGRDPNIALTKIIDRRVWATSESIQFRGKNNNGLVSDVDGKVYVDIETLLNGRS